MNNLRFLFLYLKKRNIHLNRREFIVQYESHPAFPSLLALSDTLRFFNVENGALHVQSSEIDALPNFFMTKFKHAQEDSLALVEIKNSHRYTIYENSNKRTISKSNLLQEWLGIVFLIENTEETNLKKIRYSWKHILLTLCVLSFFGLCTAYVQSLPYFVFFLLPVIGCTLSIVALKDVFNIKNPVVAALCDGETTTNCKSVMQTAGKLTILSDLCFVFFTYQLLAFTISVATQTFQWYLSLQKIIVFTTIPVILFSLYYQFAVVKKRCAICMSIAGIILLELVYITTLSNITSFDQIPFSQYNFTAFLFFAIALGWYFLKNILIENQTLKQKQILAQKFKRNYTVFKNTLTSTSKTVATPPTLTFGNPDALVTLDFITSPYCRYCKKPLQQLRKLLETYADAIAVRFIYNVNFKHLHDDDIHFLQQLYHLHETKGDEAFFKALNFWYQTQDYEKWLAKYRQNIDANRILYILQQQRNWCLQHKITFTPALLVNSYILPESYAIDDLSHFIDDLIEDTSKP
ncbi:protein-disulfide isomerase [Kordia periserrulae]|uniref:Protein-disulfide isomerase n=1 Tax=Kordia periserrulae TaxID=701523 RepID=A0A2T6BTY2_9FLAO|nr:thioredoxin domain-containing protein [Kordia periserrulae]PTX59522.1 protein-disulfide isomerase [Kordia periserrulae]